MVTTKEMDADALVHEHLDLIDTVAWDVVRKCRVPDRGFDDVWSAAGLALVLAARGYDPGRGNPEYVRHYLRKKMFFLVIDELRLLNGRRLVNGNPGGQYEMNRSMMSLNIHSSGNDGDSNERELLDTVEDPGAQIDFEKAGDLDEIRGFLKRLPTARVREIILRRLAGESMREIGERFGITESRVSQIVSKIGLIELEEEEVEEAKEWGKEELWDGPFSLDVSWR